ncbi:MAG: hypothetical protein IBX56_15695 [Methylomicrobium sp.]|nr:hypothetical protein [Methylomicrobium sp.]
MVRVVIDKQDEVSLFETMGGYIAIRSDVSNVGEQSIFLSPRNAIVLGEALIDFANELISADIEFEENQESF